MADTDELTDDTQERIKAFQHQSEVIQSMRNADAASYKPPGSPSEFLGRESQPRGPVSYLQANGQTGPMLVPRGASGIRGYPSEAEYAAAAAANVAQGKEDQFNADVNATGSRYPSAPRFNMPSTDQLIDAGIQAKRGQLQNEINDRIGRLRTDSDQPVVVGGGGRHPRFAPSQRDRTLAELGILERSASNLDRSQAEVIRQNSRLALQNAKDNEAFGQDVARSQVVDFMSGIDETRYPHGSEDRQKFIGKVFGSRPDWLHVMAKDPHLSKYVQDHVEAQDKVASTIAQLKTLYPDLEVTPKSVNTKGGVNYNVGLSAEDKAAERPVPEKTADRYAKLVGDITYHEKNQKVEEAANISKKDVEHTNLPYSGASKWDAAIAEKQQLERRYPSLGSTSKKAVQIPQSAMDALRNDPSLADDFDKKYGQGNAEIILR